MTINPASLLLAMGLISSAHATTVLIDFGISGNSNGNGPTSSGWNNITSTSGVSVPLKDTTDTSTGYTLTIPANAFEGSVGDAPKPTGQTQPDTATGDFFYGNTNPGIITLSGLNPLLTYDITLFGFISRNSSRMTSVTIGSVTQSYEPSNLYTSGSLGAPEGVTNPDGGGTTFTGLTSELDGSLEISFTADVSTYILSTMEISYVPEPGVAVLSCLGLLPLVRRRR